MPSFASDLLKLYLNLFGWVLVGVVLGRKLPPRMSNWLGQFLFWIGVPISIVTFLRGAHLSVALWLAPVLAWVALLSGVALARLWMVFPNFLRLVRMEPSGSLPADARSNPLLWSRPTQGSFLLAAMVGNTGYLGFPITLALVGPHYFAWAVFYDVGTTLGAYGLGAFLASRFSSAHRSGNWLVQALLQNPALWSLGVGLAIQDLPFPTWLDAGLRGLAWSIVTLALMLIGMRLSQLTDWHQMHRAWVPLGIKMLLVPLILGVGLAALGIQGPAQLVLVLQMGMPPAFATLVLAEAYQLDRSLTVAALVVGSLGLLLTLPLWLLLFGP